MILTVCPFKRKEKIMVDLKKVDFFMVESSGEMYSRYSSWKKYRDTGYAIHERDLNLTFTIHPTQLLEFMIHAHLLDAIEKCDKIEALYEMQKEV